MKGLRAAAALLALAAALGAGACSRREPPAASMIVLGIDGMDHELTARLMEEGRLPNLKRLAERGFFQPLGTSVPPLSPVAWSNFITGQDPAAHGIYDFMHRDPDTMLPYLSTSQPAGGEMRTLPLGAWQVPLSAGGYELLRRGTPFWEVLEEAGVETSILRIPANFPVSGTATREISGMGTPDAVGSYGMFSFFTSELFFDKRDVAGGELYELDYWDGVARGALEGPVNPFRKDGRKAMVPFTLYVDEGQAAGKLEIGDSQRLLLVGEWSEWVPFDIQLVPVGMGASLQSVHGMARFYLRQVTPEVELYVSPINFDPLYGGLPNSHPADYGRELAEATGRYYTQGMPEDTQAMKGDVLTVEEFLAQARIAGEELERQYEYVLDSFEGGLLFYYFGNLDMVSHMMWGAMDPETPQ
ncbi:MAG: alkaline phosphatase family protein, partial [Thermoanaerobaculia bacterium]|nr:alkaline phosphatase family protein [Thermoanaerobaculia bacterium]